MTHKQNANVVLHDFLLEKVHFSATVLEERTTDLFKQTFICEHVSTCEKERGVLML